MRLGWKVFLPMSLMFVVVTSGWLMATGHFDSTAPTAPANTADFVQAAPAQATAERGQS